MVNLYELKGDFQKALFYQKVLEDEKKKLSLDEQGRIIMGLQVIFEDELQNQQIEMTSKEKELAKLRLSRARLWFAGGGSVGVIVFLLIFLYFQRKKHSTEQNALLLKQRLLRSQMNPHFIFNSLSGIQNFIVTEKPTKASIYLSKFATLVRNILESSVKEYVTLEKEITTIENYLELQKIRYAGKFDFSLKTDDAIDPETTMIPPMLAQPFIENAIEHGIVHSDKMGQIDVEFRLENDVILFEVRDNGVGREKSKELEAHLEKDHQSMSTSITLERLAMLNKKRKHKIIFKITDLKDHDGNAAGTFVRFGIPL
jgi:sensor histidine kinase YesM